MKGRELQQRCIEVFLLFNDADGITVDVV